MIKQGITKTILLLAAMAALLSGCAINNGPAAFDEFEGGQKQLYECVPAVVLSGSWQQMGRQYGYLLSDDIRAVYNMVSPYKDMSNIAFGKTNSEMMEELYQAYPQRFKEFFQGMSETSGLTLEQLKVANALEIFLMFGAGIYDHSMRCSALSTWGEYSVEGRVIYGRNYDYNAEFLPLDDHIVVAVFHPDNGDIPFAMVTWAGCIYASTAINQKGIYVAENDCSPHDQEAAGFYLTDGHFNMKTWVKDDVLLLSLITEAGTMAEVDAWMKNNLPCYPHNIGVADRNEARSYQWNIDGRIPHAPYAQQASGLMAQTNHYYVVPEGWGIGNYVEEDSSGSGIPGGSIPRLNNLLQLADRFKGSIDVARMCDILDVKLEDGGAIVDSTLYQVVCEPETFTLKMKTKGKAERWVDIPLATILFPGTAPRPG